MKKIIILALALTGCTITLHEDPKLLASQAALVEHIDRLTLSIDRAVKQADPPKHVVCREKDGKKTLIGVEQLEKGEKDLGAAGPCPPPNEVAVCIGGVPFSVVEAHCEAGK
jgi:hypothetical protein